jgi:hypothetical protein
MIRKGTTVEWDWGSGTAAGKVTDRFEQKVKRTLKGSDVTRNGITEDPSLLIEQDDGTEVLKLHHEVRRA